MKRIFIVLFLLFSVNAYAVQYNKDSIVLDANKLTEIQILDVIGASAVDTFPDEKWCTDNGAPYKYSNGNINNGCIPDGAITKTDSPYYNKNVPDLGQRKLYQDRFNGNIQKYPGYVDGSWRGKKWDQLSIFRKMYEHLEVGGAKAKIGWMILIKANVLTTLDEYNLWSQTKSIEGFNDSTAVIFTNDNIEVNTRYLYGNDNAGDVLRVSALDENNRSIWLSLFIKDQAVYDKFIMDLLNWNTSPNLNKINDTLWKK